MFYFLLLFLCNSIYGFQHNYHCFSSSILKNNNNLFYKNQHHHHQQQHGGQKRRIRNPQLLYSSSSGGGINPDDPYDSQITDLDAFDLFIESLRVNGKIPKIKNKKQRKEFIKKINILGNDDSNFQLFGGTLDKNNFTKNINDDPLMNVINTIIINSYKRKAQDINVIRVSLITVMTEFMIMMNGFSRPQNDAIAKTIQEELLNKYNRTCSKQGTSNSGWILLDYDDIIIHIMTPKSRQYYDLDGLWSKGEVLDISDIISNQSMYQTLPNKMNLNEKNSEFILPSPDNHQIDIVDTKHPTTLMSSQSTTNQENYDISDKNKMTDKIDEEDEYYDTDDEVDEAQVIDVSVAGKKGSFWDIDGQEDVEEDEKEDPNDPFWS
mmetsp:Transcript_47141/g.60582  ORF Transcript_47141/g.60582 Transcript_47141/m.60582 type:complete len:379 (+) Transcript_47141:204-1340(+)